MKARPIVRSKEVRDDGMVLELVVWELADPLSPCTHNFKYRLYFGRSGLDAVRYDNERGKGDHRHCGGTEHPYAFVSIEQLLDDFERDVQDWRPE